MVEEVCLAVLFYAMGGACFLWAIWTRKHSMPVRSRRGTNMTVDKLTAYQLLASVVLLAVSIADCVDNHKIRVVRQDLAQQSMELRERETTVAAREKKAAVEDKYFGDILNSNGLDSNGTINCDNPVWQKTNICPKGVKSCICMEGK